MVKTVLPLEDIDFSGFKLPQPDCALSPAENSFLEEIAWNCLLISLKKAPALTVFKHNNGYCPLGNYALAYAYAAHGIKTVPAEVLHPDHLDIPTYIRRGQKLSDQKC